MWLEQSGAKVSESSDKNEKHRITKSHHDLKVQSPWSEATSISDLQKAHKITVATQLTTETSWH